MIDPKWAPSPHDAINLSALHIYALTIERLSLLIYRSDPDPDRPSFERLQELLGAAVGELRAYAKQVPTTMAVRCYEDDELCDDGLCHPPGECS